MVDTGRQTLSFLTGLASGARKAVAPARSVLLEWLADSFPGGYPDGRQGFAAACSLDC